MNLDPIGIVESCFKEKFSTPRQSGLVELSTATINIEKLYSNYDAFCDLREHEYIWVIFYFHLNQQSWKTKVRPPRLGGNLKKSVFSTRSPFRPNPIGLSLVKLNRVYLQRGIVKLDISSHDLVQGTPVIDIKPYHYQADNIQLSKKDWIEDLSNKNLKVIFRVNVKKDLEDKISQILCLDPRPSYHNDETRVYGSLIDDYNVTWKVLDNILVVLSLEQRK